MQFNTFLYIMLFLPAVWGGWYAIGHFSNLAARLFLIGMSLWFYGYAGVDGLKWLLISIAVNWTVVLLLRHYNKKSILWLGIIFNIALLFYFKYTNFTITTINALGHKTISLVDDIVLPIGISFFTFQQISYLVDAYRGEINSSQSLVETVDKADKDNKTEKISKQGTAAKSERVEPFIDYLLYVLFFPKILMGPIVKQRDLIPQFHSSSATKLSSSNLICGIQMFTFGLFKKVILADTFANAVTWGFRLPDWNSATSMDMVLIMFAYSFQIYFDFSGYSDMAIGSALMLNIKLPMNFDSPYKAESIRDFWKRWHISLTKFLTEYIYIPLGGSRKGKIRTYVNTMIVFLVSGFWHGANWTFVLWGVLHGVFSCLDRVTERVKKNIHPALKWMVTFAMVSILWFLFRADSINQWKLGLLHTFAFQSTDISGGLINAFVLPETAVLVKAFHLTYVNEDVRGLWMLLFYVMGFVICLGFENTYRRKYSNNIIVAIGSALLLVFTFTCLGTESAFVYYGF